jgi:hypothetical protein
MLGELLLLEVFQLLAAAPVAIPTVQMWLHYRVLVAEGLLAQMAKVAEAAEWVAKVNQALMAMRVEALLEVLDVRVRQLLFRDHLWA